MWEHALVSGGGVDCSYSAVGGNWTWAAHCNITAFAEVCFTAYALSAVGLVSHGSTSCAVVDAEAPRWAHTPSFIRSADGQLNVSWSLPTELFGQQSSIEWQLCTRVGCSEATAVSRRQRFTLIPPDHALLAEYQGAVWVVLLATPTTSAGWARSIATNTLLVGGSDISQGRLALSPVETSTLIDGIVRISGFEEPIFGISNFTWCAGTSVNVDDLIPCRSEPHLPAVLNFSAIASDIKATHGNATHTAVVSATACNPFGQCSVATSNVMTIDKAPPSRGYVADGLLILDDSDWDEVYVFSCNTTCTLVALLSGSEDTDTRERVIAPLRQLVLPELNVAVQQRGAQPLAASWGNFEDIDSGLGEALLCFGRASASVEDQTCAQASSSGMAVAWLEVEDRETYRATATVADRVGYTTAAHSAGVQMFSDAVRAPQSLNVSRSGGESFSSGGQTTAYLRNCSSLFMTWDAPAEPDCNRSLSSEWLLCDVLGNCTAARSVGSSEVSTFAAQLRPGEAYRATLRVSGCAGSSSVVSSDFIVCDSTDPEAIGTPRLLTLSVSAIGPNASEVVSVDWLNVFYDAQAPSSPCPFS